MGLIPVALATQEAKIRRISVQGQPGQKVNETTSQLMKSWALWCMPVTPAMQKA
jgi:hypothetical protein